MIVDTSAIMAVLLGEDVAPGIVMALEQTTARVSISAAAMVEATIVMRAKGGFATTSDFDRFLTLYNIQIDPITVNQAHVAREAYLKYGRGSGHPARLNFGDCFAYALARETNEPLLFVGHDFTHTDITPALS